MYAAVMTLRIEGERASEAAMVFTRVLLPRVAASAGFVAGYWLEPVDGVGSGFVLFEMEEHAVAAMPPVADWSAPGVVIEAVDFRRVAASADRPR